jgi:hypothetical protein
MAAVNGPSGPKYVTAITGKLDEAAQQEIAAIIKQVCGISTDLSGLADPQCSIHKIRLMNLARLLPKRQREILLSKKNMLP